VPEDVHHSYEWTLLHDDNAEFTLCDMDGVLCEDWTGGHETDDYGKYLDFLSSAKPRRIPSYELMGIVTNRLECHRNKTEAWLQRHGVNYRTLIMSPHKTHRERDDAEDAAIRKADAYRSLPECRLFIESCGRQARAIQRLTGRPVLSIEDNRLV
jgi:orotate phosphoribosyltransferase